MENVRLAREAENAAKLVIKQTKQEKWKQHASTINSKEKTGKVWMKIKKMALRYVPHSAPIITANGIITNNKDKSEAFARYFAKLYKNNNHLFRE